MAGWLILGNPRVGKSRVVKEQVIPSWLKRGTPVAVLDPVSEDMDRATARAFWSGASMVSSDPEAFQGIMRRSNHVVAIVDELAEWAARDYKNMDRIAWLSICGGNRGILPYFIGQRMVFVPPRIRNLCTDGVIVFQQSEPDARAILDSYPMHPGVMAVTTYPPGVALVMVPNKQPMKIRVF
jgi:hypothetical protein